LRLHRSTNGPGEPQFGDHIGPSLEVFPDRKTSWDRAVCRRLIGKRGYHPKKSEVWN